MCHVSHVYVREGMYVSLFVLNVSESNVDKVKYASLTYFINYKRPITQVCTNEL